MQNPSYLLYGPHDARIQDRPLPALSSPTDVIVQIAYTGVCGSDVHFWHAGGIRKFVSPSSPITMGHEASGTIHAVGSAVTHLVPGDKVAIEPGYPCRRCDPCKSGRYNLCPRMQFAADPGSGCHGTLSRYFMLPGDFCYKVPDGSNIGLKEAVLVEPLSVAVHTVRLADVKPGQNVVVFGAGTVGVFCAAVAREFGAGSVTVVDVNEKRLEFARRIVGDTVRVYVPGQGLGSKENAQAIASLSNAREGLDIALDASGAEQSTQTAIYALRPGGTYVQAGMGKRNIEFPIAEMCEKEITVRGCFRYGAGDFELAMKLAADGRLRLDEFVTAVYPFEKAPEAWDAAGRGEGVKTVIQVGGL